MKNNNILIVGSGVISEIMIKYGINHQYNIEAIPLRQLDKYLKNSEIEKFAVIVYTGYDHFSILRNINYLKIILGKIEIDGWSGNFIFLNTQSIIEDDISRCELRSYEKWFPNRYVLTKKWQSVILEKSKINYINYIIPIVTGEGTAQEKQLEWIANTDTKIPNQGRNYFYFIETKKLLSEIFSNIELSSEKNRKCFFVYSEYISLKDKLNNDYGERKQYESTEAQNAYNLSGSELIKYIVNKGIRSYIAIVFYSFVRGNLSKKITDKTNKIKLSWEEHQFYSKSFIPPGEIRKINIIKL